MHKIMVRMVICICGLMIIPGASLAQEDAATIDKKPREALTRGDVDAALALYADDAVLEGFPACNSFCRGKAAIRKALERRVEEKVTATAVASYPSGNVITTRNEVRTNGTRKAGVERVVRWDILEAKDGKIVSVRILFELSDAETARYRESRAERRKSRTR